MISLDELPSFLNFLCIFTLSMMVENYGTAGLYISYHRLFEVLENVSKVWRGRILN